MRPDGNGFGRDGYDGLLRDVSAWSGRHRSWLTRGGIALAVVVMASTSYYQVEPDEVAVVTRFGRFVRITPPGPHGRLPLGMERVQKVPVERQLKQEFGFRTAHADVQSTYHRDDTTA